MKKTKSGKKFPQKSNIDFKGPPKKHPKKPYIVSLSCKTTFNEPDASDLEWLSKQTGKPYRLLTEAEWEYAARGRTTPGPAPRFFYGDDAKQMCKYGNGADQTAQKTIPGADKWTVIPCPDGYAYTAPVGSFSPNPFGLHDMHGNVWEWVADCWHDSYNGTPPDRRLQAWTTGTTGDCSRRVVRGGSWSYGPQFLRAAYRGRFTANSRYDTLGFRVGRTLLTH
jgi:formylglycine-generating enzyme required for sulfatase activity